MNEHYEVAIEHFMDALKIQPDNLSCLNIRAYCYKALEKWELWLKDYDHIERLSDINSKEQYRVHKERILNDRKLSAEIKKRALAVIRWNFMKSNMVKYEVQK